MLRKWFVAIGIVLLLASVVLFSASGLQAENAIYPLAPAAYPGSNPINSSISWECAANFTKGDFVVLEIRQHINWSRWLDQDRYKFIYVDMIDPHNGSVTYELSWRVPEGGFRLLGINATVIYPLNGDGLTIMHNVSKNAGSFVAGIAKYDGTYRARVSPDAEPPIGQTDFPSYLGLFRGYILTENPYAYGSYVGVGTIVCGVIVLVAGLLPKAKKHEKASTPR